MLGNPLLKFGVDVPNSKFKIQKAKDFREFRSKIINEKSEKYKL